MSNFDLLLVIFAGFCCFVWGDNSGTKETEKRWSDAVKRAEWARNHDTSNP